ncbi:CHAD domain-containing protein [Thalassobaculum sp.]|uniref:CYTH and CHAD domain-containing protein n=1 Tax=Thalassobaculum sp. TaxID=2022740 RepID=UPI003B5C7D15
MSRMVVSYIPPEDWPATADSLLVTAERVRGALVGDPPTALSRTVTLRDSVDRRLTGQGYHLTSVAAEPDDETWTLSGPDGTAEASERVTPTAQTFDSDLPKGPLRSLLEDLTRGRALTETAAFNVTETAFALRDDEGKIRCRMRLTHVQDRAGATATDVSIIALKGYASDAARIRERIKDDLGWPQASAPALSRLLSALRPVQGRAGTELRPDDPAGPVMREILSAQLDVIEDRLPGVLADRHPDYLHQFRVAVRRTRSALSQLSPAIALEGRAEAVEGFRWLGRVTSPQRDLDVQLLDLAARRAQSADAEALAPLERHLEALKTASHRDLALQLSGARFQTLVAHWRDSLSPSSANWTATEPLRAPFAEIVAGRGRKILRKALREGRRIGPDSEAERLHDLRKRLKKQRYVTEFLAEVLPRDRTKPAIKALKGLQEVLGRVQDREVQVAALHRYGRELAGRKGVSSETLMALGAWSEELDRDRRAARAEFAAAFKSFASRETQALFRAIFDTHTARAVGGQPKKRGAKED